MVVNGIILINKARGVSSNYVVNKVKRILNADKAGHFGTLDVLGEGLLPIALGKGTKLFDYFLNKDKIYKTIFKFGETSSTLDCEGEIIAKNDVIVTNQDVKNILPQFIGKLNQLPPNYSAKKINGVRAYDLAREGKEVNLKPKEIEIYSIKLIKEVALNTFEFEVWCSSGTYIRSLCRDIAEKLNTYGIMLSIQRTKCGDFKIENAVTLEELKQDAEQIKIIQLDSIFNFESLFLNLDQSKKILNGSFIPMENKDGEYKIYHQESFLGIGKIKNNILKLDLRLI